jgi:hypothetical protein|tara:strand:+ start:2210 stop:2542 length:333 start_codon:yes stop_codon:yes gene_type:complete
MEIPDEVLHDMLSCAEERSESQATEKFIPVEIQPEGREIELGLRIVRGRDMEVCVRVDGKVDSNLDERGWCYVSCVSVLLEYAQWAESLSKMDTACGGKEKTLAGWGQVK